MRYSSRVFLLPSPLVAMGFQSGDAVCFSQYSVVPYYCKHRNEFLKHVMANQYKRAFLFFSCSRLLFNLYKTTSYNAEI